MVDVDARESAQQANPGPVESLLRQSTTATHRAVNAIRSAEAAKANLRDDINSLTTSFDKAIQKSLALIDRLDESVYSGRIDNAQKRAKIEKEAQALIDKAHSNPAENSDLRLFERTVDVLKDSAIGLHREYFDYDETVDANDILAQKRANLKYFLFHVLEYTYRTNALQKSVKDKEQKMKQGRMETQQLRSQREGDAQRNSTFTWVPHCLLEDILNELSVALREFQDSDAAIKTLASNVEKIVDEMKDKLARGVYGETARRNPTDEATFGTRRSTVAATTSGYTL
ncbi:hypothetical protein RB195_005639 [Necator americanus]|uniref:Uncharacterized protein n=1 Tax=Necator americanus TaxID=51031 RepID=A0ABR1BS09_NECAM